MSMYAGAATDTPAVEIIGLHKWFGEFHVLSDINLEVGRGDLTGIDPGFGQREFHEGNL